MSTFAYRVGLPFWKAAARAGMMLSLRVDLSRDEAAGVYVATSPDLDGLVVESSTFDQLLRDLDDCVGMLMDERLHLTPKVAPRADLRLTLGHCLA